MCILHQVFIHSYCVAWWGDVGEGECMQLEVVGQRVALSGIDMTVFRQVRGELSVNSTVQLSVNCRMFMYLYHEIHDVVALTVSSILSFHLIYSVILKR